MTALLNWLANLPAALVYLGWLGGRAKPQLPPPPRPAPTPEPTAQPGHDDVMAVVNPVRVRYGRAELAHAPELDAISVVNNNGQAAQGKVGHPYTYGHAQVAAGNYPDAASVVDGWMNSPPHRAIILDPTLTQIGWAHAGPYWTATFA